MNGLRINRCILRGCACCALVLFLTLAVYIICRGIPVKKDEVGNSISSYRYSYYQQDSDKKRIIAPNYIEEKTLLSRNNTAVVVMDPWKISSSAKADIDSRKNMEEYVIPLVDSCVRNGVHSIYIFTNNPSTTSIEDGVVIYDELMRYVDDKKIFLRYHDEFPSCKKFVKELEAKGIRNVIYMGYHTNMCILYRMTGIIPVHLYTQKLNLYIVPEATLAIINDNDENNLSTRDAMCLMLAQNNIARIIHAQDLLNFQWR